MSDDLTRKVSQRIWLTVVLCKDHNAKLVSLMPER